ncbi:MAG: histidinol phosphate phosphatase domain-containing protein [Candidatus Methanoplasma sp.]|jgi:histidinol phosphatase-like PHP family hydrolase|nr:histidinol phosphate phosphatase domain-containing protein [Candidatus Methanoplasma sp.]
MRIDLHTHTIFSDGELIPSELVRRAMALGHDAIALTDHVDTTNVDFVVPNLVRATELNEHYIRVIPGVEITHVPPSQIAAIAKRARKLGAQWIVVHGETVTEPVAPGTNLESVKNPDIDVLAHPGFITLEEAEIAARNDVILEITGRYGHNITNGHVAAVARAAKAKLVVNSDAHAPDNLMDEGRALKVALGAGLTKDEAERALHITPYEAIKHLK